MACRSMFLVLLFAAASAATAQDASPGRRISNQVSPLGTFDLITYQRREVLNTVTELRLEGRKPGFEDQLLFRGGESTWAIISPDEEWIAVNSAESDRRGLLHLFRRGSDNRFERVEAEVERRALAVLMKATGRTEPPRFDRFFCYADFWSEESGCLLGHIEARERGEPATSRFYFVYDPVANRVSLDLKLLNRGAFAP